MASLSIQQIRGMVEASIGGPPPTLAQRRANLDALGAKMAMPAGVEVEPVDVDGVRAEWLRPAGSEGERRRLVYFHGGGYMLGSLASSRALIARIAVAVGAPALSCDYRLAPEHPYPAALEDGLSVYRWLTRETGREPGVSPASIVLVGTSAGANLSLAMCLRIRAGEGEGEQRLELPGAVVGMSTWLDMRCDADSLANAGDPLCRKRDVDDMVAAFLAGHDPDDPLVSPARAELGGLPPMLLQAGAAEGLRDENQAFAARAQAQGAALRFELYDEMIHAWQVFAPMLAEANEAIDSIARFVRETVRV